MKTFFCLILIASASGQQFMQNCDELPTPEQRQVCRMLQRMARNSRRNSTEQRGPEIVILPPVAPDHLRPAPLDPDARGQMASHPYDCMTVTCLCPFFSGTLGPQGQCLLPNGQILTMAYRKEYRMLTEDERLRYHNAVTMLKRSGEYDRMSFEHMSVGQGSGAHSGPGFLPWHREFTKRFEIAIRLIDPTVSVPYWDSVLDSYLPNPADSILFSPYFVGETDNYGNVVTGPYAYWSTIDGQNAIIRAVGEKGRLFTESDIADIMSRVQIEEIMAYTAPLNDCPFPPPFTAIEYTHSFVHLWVGGHMEPPEQASNDPIFYSHHSYVDLIWELWRQARQSRWARETQYSQDLVQCADPQHFSYAVMRPFNLINRDGLSNLYTDQMYRFAPRPGCTVEIPTCGSPYLFCDLSGSPHCVSKIRMGGICSGFEGMDACFNGNCIMGRCVPGPTPAPFIPQIQLPPAQRIEIVRQQAARQFIDCFNRNPCCEQWAREGQCSGKADYMDKFCPAACRNCRPAYNVSNECADRHVSCKQWSMEGQCTGNSSEFMAENCRSSCKLCGVPKNAKCLKPKAASIKSKQSARSRILSTSNTATNRKQSLAARLTTSKSNQATALSGKRRVAAA